jgi:agmatinase
MSEVPVGQGHGIEGKYCGLPPPYSKEDFSKIVILPVPFDLTTTYKRGSDRGPAALIEASRNLELYDIETDTEVFLNGIYTAPPIVEATSEKMLQVLYKKTDHYLNQEKFVVTIGGEHSISWAPIKAHAEKFKKITVLQFDAHADLQDAYENNSLSHASVMARVQEISEVVKIVSVGIRSLSKEELKNLDRRHTFFAHELNESEEWENQFLSTLLGPIYITFDLDVFDSSLMPSTGTPEPGGLFWNQTMRLLKRVIMEKAVVGFDVVELCPQDGVHAPDYLAAKLIYKVLSYHFFIKQRRS